MRLFDRRFKRYIQKNELRRSDNNLVNSRKTKIKGAVSKKEKCPNSYECGNVGHLKNECPNLIKARDWNVPTCYGNVIENATFSSLFQVLKICLHECHIPMNVIYI